MKTSGASAPSRAAGITDEQYAQMQDEANVQIEEIGQMDTESVLAEIQSTLDHARILADGMGYSDHITSGESLLLTGVERLSLMLEGVFVWIKANTDAAALYEEEEGAPVSQAAEAEDGDGHL